MRLSLVFLAVAVSLASMACAAQPGAAATPAATVPAQPAAVAVPAAADKVYPPLPTLAMLPPSTGEEDDETAPAAHHASKHGRKSRRSECHCSAPSPHLVVSDESRAYLQDVERQLDVALAR